MMGYWRAVLVEYILFGPKSVSGGVVLGCSLGNGIPGWKGHFDRGVACHGARDKFDSALFRISTACVIAAGELGSF